MCVTDVGRAITSYVPCEKIFTCMQFLASCVTEVCVAPFNFHCTGPWLHATARMPLHAPVMELPATKNTAFRLLNQNEVPRIHA